MRKERIVFMINDDVLLVVVGLSMGVRGFA